MKIDLLELKNFRNYDYFKIEPKPEVNLIIGKNAIGKTNLLEAIYLVLVGKSFRTSRTGEMIKIGCDSSKICAKVENDGYFDDLEIVLNSEQKNEYTLNSESMSLKKYTGDFFCVIFSPNDLNMIKLSPNERRRYIDNIIEKISPTYRYNIEKYKKIIYERNKLLKNPREELLKVYDFQLVECGIKVLIERMKFIKELEVFANNHYKRISNGQELKLTYLSTINFNRENIKSIFTQMLMENRKKDIESKFTTIGPHRDDIDFKVNSMSSKKFASQGEIRSIVLALKLAEIDLIEKFSKKKPILLLDDVFSELDKSRAKYLSQSLDKMQTFITGTNFNEENFIDFTNKINVERL